MSKRFTVRGPGSTCTEIQAGDLEQAIQQVKQHHPNKMVAADATEVIYVCNANEEETACQMKLI
ncbi:hypothetical protein V6C27_04110 [Peptococcaceae bacterium 1198_IL3148]